MTYTSRDFLKTGFRERVHRVDDQCIVAKSHSEGSRRDKTPLKNKGKGKRCPGSEGFQQQGKGENHSSRRDQGHRIRIRVSSSTSNVQSESSVDCIDYFAQRAFAEHCEAKDVLLKNHMFLLPFQFSLHTQVCWLGLLLALVHTTLASRSASGKAAASGHLAGDGGSKGQPVHGARHHSRSSPDCKKRHGCITLRQSDGGVSSQAILNPSVHQSGVATWALPRFMLQGLSTPALADEAGT